MNTIPCSSKLKKVVVAVGLATFSVAIHQANTLRQTYKDSVKLDPPAGPNSGFEKWVTKLNRLRESLKDEKDDVVQKTAAMLRELKLKVTDSIEKTEKTARSIRHDNIAEKITKSVMGTPCKNPPKKPSKRVKLILLGDSLVCGVGCDSDGENSKSSPVLPKILAKILSIAMHADVEWFSMGIIGGTVSDLRSDLLPQVRRKLTISCHNESTINDDGEITQSSSHEGGKTSQNNSDDVEIIVVVICGMNDWKLLVEQFPYGPGPATYRNELSMLIEEIKVIGTELSTKCKVFLPAIPLGCGKGDPNYHLDIAPLTYFVNFVCYVWDQQKKSVALDSHVRTNLAIGSVSFKCHLFNFIDATCLSTT